MMARLAVLSVGLLLASTATGRAQEAELERALELLAASWASGDAAALAAHTARTGVSLDVDGEPVGPLAPRQAAAVLRRLFANLETLSLQPGMAHVVGGRPLRAFGELAWVARAHGTTIPDRATVFVALVWEDDAWHVTQIRILR